MSTTKKTKVTINNEALATALGVKKGGTVLVDTRKGVPTSKYWRNRFRDAKIDKSITVPNNTKKAKQPTSEGDK